MRSYTIKVGGTEWKCSTASAEAQFEAMHIAGRTGLLTIAKGELADTSMVGLMFGADMKDVERLIELLVNDCVVRSDDSVPVGKNLFQDRPQDFYLVVAHAIKENLAGFWQLRRPEKSPAIQAAEQ